MMDKIFEYAILVHLFLFVWTKIAFLNNLKVDQNRLLTRDQNYRRENKVDQNRLFGTSATHDLNSFKHFSGPKNKTLRILSKI